MQFRKKHFTKHNLPIMCFFFLLMGFILFHEWQGQECVVTNPTNHTEELCDYSEIILLFLTISYGFRQGITTFEEMLIMAISPLGGKDLWNVRRHSFNRYSSAVIWHQCHTTGIRHWIDVLDDFQKWNDNPSPTPVLKLFSVHVIDSHPASFTVLCLFEKLKEFG